MEIKTHGSRPSNKGPAEYFTGSARIDPLFQPTGPGRVPAGLVAFEPGARTAWHTHPLGQHLIVTTRCARGEKHWHGATATTGMSHIAIQEFLDGRAVDWMAKVTDEQYNG